VLSLRVMAYTLFERPRRSVASPAIWHWGTCPYLTLLYYYAPAPRVGALSDDARLTSVCLMSDVCLSVAYIGPKSRTERSRKTKIGTEVAHVTYDSDTTFTVRRSKINLQGAGHIVAASRSACLLPAPHP